MVRAKDSAKIRSGVSSKFLTIAQLVIGLIGILWGSNALFASKEALDTEIKARVSDTKEINRKLDIILNALLENK